MSPKFKRREAFRIQRASSTSSAITGHKSTFIPNTEFRENTVKVNSKPMRGHHASVNLDAIVKRNASPIISSPNKMSVNFGDIEIPSFEK